MFLICYFSPAPLAVDSVEISDVTEDTMLVSWTPSSDPNIFSVYRIEYGINGETERETVYVAPPTQERKLEFLRPEETYEVTVYTEVYAGSLTETSTGVADTATTRKIQTFNSILCFVGTFIPAK